MPMLFSPTIGVAIAASYWFLWVRSRLAGPSTQFDSNAPRRPAVACRERQNSKDYNDDGKPLLLRTGCYKNDHRARRTDRQSVRRLLESQRLIIERAVFSASSRVPETILSFGNPSPGS